MGIEREKGLTMGSLFDGSGGFPLAGIMCGITPVWASEIDPFCVEVTSKRFPNMKHLGDITKIKGGEIPPVNIITFGSPCQDLSVAGNRAGLDGSRSSLFLEAIRIFKEMREVTNGIYPNVVVWENVPGAYTSHKGENFRRVLEEIAGVADSTVSIPRPADGKWNACGCIMGDSYSIAWRTLDAEYWGVPQRRKRIFLVADFRGGCAPEILFKREGLRGNFKACGKTREKASAVAESGVGVSDFAAEFTPKTLKIRSGCEGGGKGALIQENKSATISCNNDQVLFEQIHSKYAAGFKGRAGAKAGNIEFSENVSPTLQAEQDTHCLCYSFYPQMKAESQCFTENISNTLVNGTNPGFHNAVIYDCRGNGDRNTCPTITGDHNNRVTDYMAVVLNDQGGDSISIDYGIAPTLRAETHGNEPCVISEQIYSLDRAAFNQGENAKYDFSVQENTAQTIVARGSGAVANIDRMIVRRLMPVEEARLQGFPDWWCADIPHKDTPEYRMWGNGVALPCVLYVMEGVAENLNNGSGGKNERSFEQKET